MNEFQKGDNDAIKLHTLIPLIAIVITAAGGFWYLANWAGQIAIQVQSHSNQIARNTERLSELERRGSSQVQELMRHFDETGHRIGTDESTISTLLNSDSLQSERIISLRNELDRQRQQQERIDQDLRAFVERMIRIENRTSQGK